MKYRVTYHAC